MFKINLKEIVPDLEKRLKKLNVLRIAFTFLALLIIPVVPAMIVMAKYAKCLQLTRAVRTVKMYDKIPLTNALGYVSNITEAAQKLIDTGNLSEYRVVAGVMFVKEGTYITEEQALKEAAACFSIPAAVNAGMPEGSMKKLAEYAAKMQQDAVSAAANASQNADGNTNMWS